MLMAKKIGKLKKDTQIERGGLIIYSNRKS